MNRSFDQGIFPDVWKIANIISIFKKGDKSLPPNCKPVSLLSCIGKLQEKMFLRTCTTILLIITYCINTSQDFFPTTLQIFS